MDKQSLALINGVNSGAGSKYDVPRIERDIPTIDGATYTFTLDYAAALGLAAANARIGVYLDGVQIGSYASAGGANALNWEALSFSFKGNGSARSLRIQLEGASDTSTAKGAMIDALMVVETRPASASVAYGFANGAVVLPLIGSSLTSDDDGGKLRTELLGLPGGAVLSDGVKRIVISAEGQVVDLSGWNMAKLVLTPPRNFTGSIKLQLRATSIHADNGSSATAARELTVTVFAGAACATPAGVNPYVNYLANISVVAAGVDASIVAGVFSPILTGAVVVPGIIGDTSVANTTDSSFEDWLRRMTGSVGDALMDELRRIFK